MSIFGNTRSKDEIATEQALRKKWNNAVTRAQALQKANVPLSIFMLSDMPAIECVFSVGKYDDIHFPTRTLQGPPDTDRINDLTRSVERLEHRINDHNGK